MKKYQNKIRNKKNEKNDGLFTRTHNIRHREEGVPQGGLHPLFGVVEEAHELAEVAPGGHAWEGWG